MTFDIHMYSEEKKVKLVVVEFTDYAIVWWEKEKEIEIDQLARGKS
jgi:hypothetical protein